MKPIILVVTFSLSCIFLQAQTPVQIGTLKLRNGWEMHGRFTTLPDGRLEWSSPRGERLTIPKTEVDTLLLDNSGKVSHQWYRFGHYTEIGALATTKNRPDNVTTAAFSFQVVNGYRFRPGWFVGIGIGLDLYATQTTLPVFASLRTDILPRKELTPYLFLDAGQGFDITTGNSSISYKGGALFAAGAGLKVHVSPRTAFHVQAGYRLQKGSTVENGVERGYNNQRISLRAGFAL
jgi:hypothetical protein